MKVDEFDPYVKELCSLPGGLKITQLIAQQASEVNALLEIARELWAMQRAQTTYRCCHCKEFAYPLRDKPDESLA